MPERGPSWSLRRTEGGLGARQWLTKVHRLLGREGIEIPYPSLHRFAVAELRFGQQATTIAALDGEPGGELPASRGACGARPAGVLLQIGCRDARAAS